MSHVIAISGSLRKQSYNSALLRAAAALAPVGLEIEIAPIANIPMYDGDLEQREFPVAVSDLKQRISAADALLIATPEYNNSIPGPLKNAIDWLTRPPADVPRVFFGRPIALIGASNGNFGTALSQAAWLPVLRTLKMLPYFGPKLLVTNAARVFDEQGALTDAKVRERLSAYLEGYAAFLARVGRVPAA